MSEHLIVANSCLACLRVCVPTYEILRDNNRACNIIVGHHILCYFRFSNTKEDH